MNDLIQFLFPKRLARLSYFVRALLSNGLFYYFYGESDALGALGIIALILVGLYQIAFVILPRIRDIGMSPFWIILAFIPYLEVFLSVALLWRRTDPSHNPLAHLAPAPTSPPPPPSDSAARS